ncbi:glycosyltransferase family 2 protein [Aliivibrio sp. S10_S31]|uniref:glycosyltransferase family 2 protein n=1 Tax=Aliivibrio sp. S10_S31 TaxID=2720224 RepID=UPI0016809FA7|nr:glycosyltransferase family 2 protein [Aliivibrio sp. S10_S31]
MNKVSVIIAAYNVEEYIDDCIKSILMQSYKDIEIIIIDDCSTDTTKEKLSKYTSEKIKIIFSDENSGPGGARNKGLDDATGDYIFFIDSDDILHPDAIRDMLQVSLKSKCDIFAASYFKFSSILNVGFSHKINFSDISKIDKIDFILKRGFAPWGMLIKSNILHGVRFPVHMVGEDVVFTPLLLDRANSMLYSAEKIVGYRFLRSGSVSEGVTKHNKSMLDALNILRSYRNISKEYLAFISFYIFRHIYSSSIKYHDFELLNNKNSEINNKYINLNLNYRDKLSYKMKVEFFLIRKHLIYKNNIFLFLYSLFYKFITILRRNG